MADKPRASSAPSPRPFPTGPGGVELTWDAEGSPPAAGRAAGYLALIGEGPHARVYKARSGFGDVAMKIQKETAPDPNPITEERWTREFEALNRYGGEEPGLLAVEPIPGFESVTEMPTFEPLFLCRERGITFSFPCPRCLRTHVLADCRDDEALRAAGLPPWSTSTERFVWCTACGREDPVFYTRVKHSSSPRLLDFVELVRTLRTAVDRGLDTEPLVPELLSGLTEDFPCVTCELRAACYPRADSTAPGKAEARLTPVSMNEFHAWPLPLCSLSFAEGADVLSGTPPAELIRMHSENWKTPAVHRSKEAAVRRGAPPDPLQAFAAKVDLFAQAVQSVHRLHVLSGAPHLGIGPDHLLVDPGDGGTPLVRLTSPGGARRLKDLNLPPPQIQARFAAPALTDSRFGREYQVRVHVEKVWHAENGTFFAGTLSGEGLGAAEVTEKDELCLVLSGEGWAGIPIWCRPLSGARARPDESSLKFVTEPREMDERLGNDLEVAKGKSPLFGTATPYRDFGIPLDVFSLGMILFRTFLVNGSQSFGRVVEELLLPVASSVELFRNNRPDADLDAIRDATREFLSGEPWARLADPAQVWHEPKAADTSRIPREAWFDLLVLGIRAVTFLPGFSYAHSDRAVFEDSGAPTREMLSELDRIGERISKALLSGEEGQAEEAAIPAARPLTDKDLEEITGEVRARLESEVASLKEQLEAALAERTALFGAWDALYRSVVGKPDPDRPPSSSEDGRISLLTATVEESIDCITQVFKGIYRLAGDELGENVPRIRVFIQDALFESQGGKIDAAGKVKKIRRQLKALRMALFAVVQTFLEANSHSTKVGTKALVDEFERKLFAPVVRGRREREPDVGEIRRRLTELKVTLPDNHHRIFQPYFQEYVRKKLQKFS